MMILAGIIIIFTISQMIVAFVNLVSETSLPDTRSSLPDNVSPSVSILIPVRNEEKNIANILDDLISRDFQNIEIILFNDQSEDTSAAIIQEYRKRDKRIHLLHSEGLPEGWLGKNCACHSLSKHAKGDYLLFLDADVRIGGNAPGKALSYALKHDLSLISVFPRQIIITAGERITVPNMNYILVSLLPLILVRKSKYPSLAAANGQFMFFRAADYHLHEPHKLMRNHKVEDILIARYLKKTGLKISCLLGDDDISCRMYNGFHEATEGFSKNVLEFFGNSFFLSLLFWLTTSFGFLIVFFYLPLPVFVFYLAAYILTRVFISAASRQNILFNLLMIIPLQISLGIFIYKALINKFFRKYQWKGRSIS